MHARGEGIEVTADIYPYTYWQSTLEVLFPERDYDNPESAQLRDHRGVDPSGNADHRFRPRARSGRQDAGADR